MLVTASWSTLAVYLHEFMGLGLISIPIVPISTIGIAVSLYLGFRSRASYDRWWEARKIWGDISSASLGFLNQVNSIMYKEDTKEEAPDYMKKELLFRHLAWMTILKHQLRNSINYAKTTNYFKEHLNQNELEKAFKKTNPATHIILNQAQALKDILSKGYFDSMRHREINGLLLTFYETQEQCERIKRTPFPRYFSYLGQVFTWMFIILLPLGFLDTFSDEGARYIQDASLKKEYMFILVPFTVILSWIFFMMEKVSEDLEDPFNNDINDIPLDSIIRSVEIDILESLNEENIPNSILPIDDILH